jgi:hypothetical protein
MNGKEERIAYHTPILKDLNASFLDLLSHNLKSTQYLFHDLTISLKITDHLVHFIWPAFPDSVHPPSKVE